MLKTLHCSFLLLVFLMVLCIFPHSYQQTDRSFVVSDNFSKSKCKFKGYELKNEYNYRFTTTVKLDNANFRQGVIDQARDTHIFAYTVKLKPIAASTALDAVYLRMSIVSASFKSLFSSQDVQSQVDKENINRQLLAQLQRPFYFKQDCNLNIVATFFPATDDVKNIQIKAAIADNLSTYITVKGAVTNVEDTIYGSAQTLAYEQEHDAETGCINIAKTLVPANKDVDSLSTDLEKKTQVCVKQVGDAHIPTEIKSSEKVGFEHSVYTPGQTKTESMLSEGAYMVANAETNAVFDGSSATPEEANTLASTFASEDDFFESIQDFHGENMEASTLSLEKIIAREKEQQDQELEPKSTHVIKQEAIEYTLQGLRQDNTDIRGQSYKTLVNMLKTSPNVFQFLTAFFESEQYTKESQYFKSSIINALADSHVKGVQTFLGRLLTSQTTPKKEREAILAALSLVPQPTDSLIEAISQGASSEESAFRSQSILALGEVVHKLKEYPSRQATRERVYNLLVAYLDKAAQESNLFDLEIAVYALENARHDASIPLIKQHIAHQSPSVRAAALSALKNFEHDSHKYMVTALLGDNDAYVRFSAAKALRGFKTLPSDVEVKMIEQFVNEYNKNVKHELYKLIKHRHMRESNAADIIFSAAIRSPDFFLAIDPNAYINITNVVSSDGHLRCAHATPASLCSGRGAVRKALSDHFCFCECKAGFKGRHCELKDCSALQGWDKLKCLEAEKKEKREQEAEKKEETDEENAVEVLATVAPTKRTPTNRNGKPEPKTINMDEASLPSYDKAKPSKPLWSFYEQFGTSDIYAGVDAAYNNVFSVNKNDVNTDFFVGGSFFVKLWNVRKPIIEAYLKFYGSFNSAKCASGEDAGTTLTAGAFLDYLDPKNLAASKKFVGFEADFCKQGDGCKPMQQFDDPYETRDIGEKSLFKFKHRTMVGPIPVSFEVELTGTMSLLMGIAATTEQTKTGVLVLLQGHVAPKAKVEVTGRLGVDMFFVAAGLGLKVTILEVSLPITVAHGVSTSKTCGAVGISVGALGGSIFVWVRLGFWIFKYTIEKNLYEWEGASYYKNLYSSKCCEDCGCVWGTCDPIPPVKCHCNAGFYGKYCSVGCPSSTNNPGKLSHTNWVCDARGEDFGFKGCTYDDTTTRTTCKCKTGFFGDSCAGVCPMNGGQFCSGQGYCGQKTIGKCNCVKGAFGFDCRYYCPDTQKGKCFGNGDCVFNEDTASASCKCNTGFVGTNCEYECPKSSDGKICGSGKCVSNNNQAQCICPPGIKGRACDKIGGSAGTAIYLVEDTNKMYSNSELMRNPITFEFWVQAGLSRADKLRVLQVSEIISSIAIVDSAAFPSFKEPFPQKCGDFVFGVEGVLSDWVPFSVGLTFDEAKANYFITVVTDNKVLLKDFKCPITITNKNIPISFTLGKYAYYDELRIWLTTIDRLNNLVPFRRRLETSQASQEPGLWSYFAFDEASGNVAYDEVVERMVDPPMRYASSEAEEIACTINCNGKLFTTKAGTSYAKYVPSSVPLRFDSSIATLQSSTQHKGNIYLSSKMERTTSATVVLQIASPSQTYDYLMAMSKRAAAESEVKAHIDLLTKTIEDSGRKETDFTSADEKYLMENAFDATTDIKKRWLSTINQYKKGYNDRIAACQSTANPLPKATFPEVTELLPTLETHMKNMYQRDQGYLWHVLGTTNCWSPTTKTGGFNPGQPPKGFKECNYNGASIRMDASTAYLSNDWKKQLSSIVFNNDFWKIVLYEKEAFAGRTAEVKSNSEGKCLTSVSANDFANSYKVYRKDEAGNWIEQTTSWVDIVGDVGSTSSSPSGTNLCYAMFKDMATRFVQYSEQMNKFYTKCEDEPYAEVQKQANLKCAAQVAMNYPLLPDVYDSFIKVIYGLVSEIEIRYYGNKDMVPIIAKYTEMVKVMEEFMALKAKEASVNYSKIVRTTDISRIIAHYQRCYSKTEVCYILGSVKNFIYTVYGSGFNIPNAVVNQANTAFEWYANSFDQKCQSISQDSQKIYDNLVALMNTNLPKEDSLSKQDADRLAALTSVISQYADVQKIIDTVGTQSKIMNANGTPEKKMSSLIEMDLLWQKELKMNSILINDVAAAYLGNYKIVAETPTAIGTVLTLEWEIDQNALYTVNKRGLNAINFQMNFQEPSTIQLKLVTAAENRFVSIQAGNKFTYKPSTEATLTSQTRLAPSDQMTFTAWIKRVNSNDGLLLGPSNPKVNKGYTINLNTVNLYLKEQATGLATPALTLPNDVWYHYAATMDGMMVRVFINGKEFYAYPLGNSTFAYPANPLDFVKDLTSGSNFALDEVAVFGVGLTSDAIRGIMLGGVSINKNVDPAEFDKLNNAIGVLMNFEEEQIGAQNIEDDSGNGNTFYFASKPDRKVVLSTIHTWERCPGAGESYAANPQKPTICDCRYDKSRQVLMCMDSGAYQTLDTLLDALPTIQPPKTVVAPTPLK